MTNTASSITSFSQCPSFDASTLFSRNVMYIDWALISESDYDCECCRCLSDNVRTAIFKKDILLKMVWKLTKIPLVNYHFYFDGGEPTLHPSLPEIINYLLYIPRNISVALATNCARNIEWYIDLFNGLPGQQLELLLKIYPEYADLRQVLTLTAAAVDKGYIVRVKLFYDNSNYDKCVQFLKAFGGLRHIVPFNMNFDCYQSTRSEPEEKKYEAWRAGAIRFFLSEADKGPKAEDFTCLLPLEQPAPAHSQQSDSAHYCCPAYKYLRIEPNGSFYISPCGRFPCHPPLCEIDDAGLEQALAAIKKCQVADCAFANALSFPNFANLSEAKMYVGKEAGQLRDQAWPLPPILNPSTLEPEPGDIVKAKILEIEKFLARKEMGEEFVIESDSPIPHGVENSMEKGRPGFIKTNFPEISRAYAMFANPESRDAFLRYLVAIEHGESPYLVGSGGVEPATSARVLKINVNWQNNQDWLQTLNATLANDSCLELVHEEDPAAFLRFIVWLGQNHPHIKLYFGRAENQRAEIVPVLYLEKAAGKNPAIANSRQPLLSVIITARDNAATLARSVESLTAQPFQDIEIIIIDDASRDDTSRVAVQCRQSRPDIIRVVRFSHQLGLGYSREKGLRLARGLYVTFMTANAVALNGFPGRLALAMCESGKNVGSMDLLSMDADGKLYSEKMPASVCPPLAGTVFNREFVNRQGLRFADSPFDLLFRVGARCFSDGIQRLDKPGYAAGSAREAPSSRDFISFCDSLATLADYLTGRGVEIDSGATINIFHSIYRQIRCRLFTFLARAGKENDLDILLDADFSRDLGRCQPFLIALLLDYAKMYCQRMGDSHAVILGGSPGQKNLTEEGIVIWPRPTDKKAALTVILNGEGEESTLKKTMRSLLAQSFTNFEIIAVIGPNSPDALTVYARLEPRFRFFVTKGKFTRGAAYNFAMTQAKGDFVMFVEAGEILRPDFLQMASGVMRNMNIDVAAFSYNVLNADGQIISRATFDDAVASQDEIPFINLPGAMDLSTCAKIFRASSIASADARFDEGEAAISDSFTYKVLRESRSIGGSSNIGADKTLLRERLSLFGDYQGLRGAMNWFEFYNCSIQQIPASFRANIWRKICLEGRNIIEKIMCARLVGLHRLTGKLPLSPRDMRKLRHNSLFIHSLLLACAMFQDDSARDKILTDAKMPYSVPQNETHLVDVAIRGGASRQRLEATLASVLDQPLINLRALVLLEPGKLENAEFLDPRIRIVRAPDSQNRLDLLKLALREASSPYVIFLAPGDVLEKDFLLRALSLLEGDVAADYVCFAVKNVRNDARPAQGRYNARDLLGLYARGICSARIAKGAVFRKAFLDELSGDFKPDNDCCNALRLYSAANYGLYVGHTGVIAANDSDIRRASSKNPFEKSLAALLNALSIAAFMSENGDIFAGKLKADIWKRYLRDYMAQEFAGLSNSNARVPDYILEKLRGAGDFLTVMLQDAASMYSLLNGLSGYEAFTKCQPGNIFVEAEFDSRPAEHVDLSIIMLANGSAEEMKATAASALGQPFENMELIIVGASQGEIYETGEALAMVDKRVQLIIAGGGADDDACLNLALRKCGGQYAAFLLAGERLEPNMLKRCMRAAQKNAVCGLVVFTAASNPAAAEITLTPREAVERVFSKASSIPDLPNMLLRRDILSGASFNRADKDNLYFLLNAIAKSDLILFSSLPFVEAVRGQYLENNNVDFDVQVKLLGELREVLKSGLAFNENDTLYKFIIDIYANNINFTGLWKKTLAMAAVDMPINAMHNSIETICQDLAVLNAFLRNYASLAQACYNAH